MAPKKLSPALLGALGLAGCDGLEPRDLPIVGHIFDDPVDDTDDGRACLSVDGPVHPCLTPVELAPCLGPSVRVPPPVPVHPCLSPVPEPPPTPPPVVPQPPPAPKSAPVPNPPPVPTASAPEPLIGPCLSPPLDPGPDLGPCLNFVQPCLDIAEPVTQPIEVGPCLEVMACLDVGPCLKVAPTRPPKRRGKKKEGGYWHAPKRADVVAKLVEHDVLPADILERLRREG